jgi:hypothetical protein
VHFLFSCASVTSRHDLFFVAVVVLEWSCSGVVVHVHIMMKSKIKKQHNHLVRWYVFGICNKISLYDGIMMVTM